MPPAKPARRMARAQNAAPPRTLVFCTAYAQSPLLWQRRYRRWVDAVLARGFGQTQILLVDDGSPVLPAWPDTDVITVHTPEDAANIHSTAPVLLLRFPNHLGRAATYDFPGWYRSFACAARYAAAGQFTKAIHLESDAYIISDRLRDWLRDTQSGWRTMWSAKFDFPEIAIQLIGADQIAAFDAFTRQPYGELIGVTHETALPCTHIEKQFIGDRYGEDEPPAPAGVDFATQMPGQREPSYYWFLNGLAGPPPQTERMEFGFKIDDPGLSLLREGWTRPEPQGSWMVQVASIAHLPPLPPAPAYDMVLTCIPHIQRALIPVQRLFVQVNLSLVGEFDFPSTLRVGCEIPGGILRRDGTDKLRLTHPDAAIPSKFSGTDHRVLAIKLRDISLRPHAAATF